MSITAKQYRAIHGKKRLSQEDEERLQKGLDPIEDEDTAQMRVVAYLELLKNETGEIVKFTAIPNNTFSGTYIAGQKFKSINAAKKQVALGLRKGLCDLLIVYKPKKYPTPGLLFLEMKREKGGVVSPDQKLWIDTLRTIPGIQVEVAKGYHDAKRIIDSLIAF